MAKKTIKKEKPVKGFEPKKEKKPNKVMLKKYSPQELGNLKSGEAILLDIEMIDKYYIAYPFDQEGFVGTNLKQMDFAVKLSDILEVLAKKVK